MCVWVPVEARSKWLTAIRRYDGLFKWAYESVENLSAMLPDARDTYEPKLHAALTADGADLQTEEAKQKAKALELVVRSHFPTWAALHLYRLKAPWNIIMPVQRLRNAAQVYYNQGKQGCDGVDDNTERLRSRTMVMSWETKRTVAFLHDTINNANILYRIYKAREFIKTWTSRRTFRAQCNKICSLADFAGTLVMQLILCSEQVARAIQRIPGTGNTTVSTTAPSSWDPPWTETSHQALCFLTLTSWRSSRNAS
jgi:hypothetical protein